MALSYTQQQDLIQHQQLEWVVRGPDATGGGAQGMRLVGLTYGEEVLFNALAITDTNMHQSNEPGTTGAPNPTGIPFDQVYAIYKTALIVSTLNQPVSLQPIWSRDRTNWYPLGSPVVLGAYAGTGTAESTSFALSSPTQYMPYVGVQATCSTAPTGGALSGWLSRLG